MAQLTLRWRLRTHGALMPVPRAECVEAERQVHPRTTVWQITGQLVVDDTPIPVLFGVKLAVDDGRESRLSEDGYPRPSRLGRPKSFNKEVKKPIEVNDLDLTESGDMLVDEITPEHHPVSD